MSTRLWWQPRGRDRVSQPSGHFLLVVRVCGEEFPYPLTSLAEAKNYIDTGQINRRRTHIYIRIVHVHRSLPKKTKTHRGAGAEGSRPR